MVKFSIFLILFAFLVLGFTLSPIVYPNNTSVLNVMERFLCEPGDNILQQMAPLASSASTSEFSLNLSLVCKRSNGSTYNVTDKLFGIGVVTSGVVLLFGVLFFFVGIIRKASGGGKPQPVSAGWTPPYYTPAPTAAPPSGGAYPQQMTATPQQGYGSSSYPTTVGYSAAPATPREAPPSDKFSFDAAATMQNIPKPPSTPAPSAQGGGELTTRLKQLREAYDAGLISNEEYERTKSDLLRDFSDDN